VQSSPIELGLTDLFSKALMIRSVERKLLELFSDGKLFGTVHTCIGQEFTGIAVAEALKPADLVFSNHRCHGHFIARTGKVEGLIAEVMGKNIGVCGGRGGSQHLCADGFFSNGVQGGIAPVAAGMAYTLKKGSSDAIAVAFIGDGTLGEGALYETMNIAAKWELPLLIVLENNRYAQSTAQHETLAGDICARASAFGIETSTGDTASPLDLVVRAKAAVDSVRKRRTPHFLRIDTYRLMAHSKGDDLRDKSELEVHWAADPVTVFQREHPELANKIQQEVSARVNAAADAAELSHYARMQTEDEDSDAFRVGRWERITLTSNERIVTLLANSLAQNMRRNERIVLLGEDVRSPYGGAFKATRGVSEEFNDRVHNTPISEAAIVGVANGMALQGFIPVAEIMFGDFIFLAGDQFVNHAAKFRYMYNEQVSVPVIVRTPMGGKRGYGPTHSQSVEKHFMGLPGTLMLALNSRQDPCLVYDRLFANIDRPTMVIENKLLYGMRMSEPLPPGYVLEYDDDVFPCVRIRPEGPPDITVVCYGGMLPDVERAVGHLFEEHELICEVMCPVQIYPLNLSPICESVKRSGRLLVVEEGLAFAAFGAEVIAALCERMPGQIKAVSRLASRRHPIPSAGPLERETLPNPASIMQAALKLSQTELS
jgi:2-oxoisovalerate dehydrogenase E1 component